MFDHFNVISFIIRRYYYGLNKNRIIKYNFTYYYQIQNQTFNLDELYIFKLLI